MIQQVVVIDGKLSVGDLQYQLYKEHDGSELTGDWRGTGNIEGGYLFCDFGLNVGRYKIARYATKESTEYSNGKAHALRQTRRREPKNVSSSYWQGWYYTWEQRKRDKELGLW